jgi:hypothetical protein
MHEFERLQYINAKRNVDNGWGILWKAFLAHQA